MKQELATTENMAVSLSQSPPVQTRIRVSRTTENPRTDAANGILPGLKTRPKPLLPESNNAHRSRKSNCPNKLRPGSEDLGSPKDRERVEGRPRSRVVEQYARLRRRGETNLKGAEEDPEDKRKELQQRLDASEGLVKELQSEISTLKAQMEMMRSLNMKLESQNKRLAEDLSSAEAKISAQEKRNQLESVKEDVQQPEFKDVRKLIAGKLENLRAKKKAISDVRTSQVQSCALEQVTKATESQPKDLPSTLTSPSCPIGHSSVRGPPPPPPPPPSRRPPSRVTTMQKAPALLEFYHSLTKRDREKSHLGGGNCNTPNMNNAHSSIVGEIQNRSAHLLSIKADVETKQDFIKFLIEKVQSAAYEDIEDALAFVNWLDRELSVLADERAVLKHFNWPERKADAMREAAFTYRDLKQLEFEVSTFKDDASMPCEAALKKMTNLLDKSERSIHKLVKSRDASMLSYKESKIPTAWMLDSGMVAKIKLASVNMAKLYMKRVSMELEAILHSERESTQETLLIQGVHFAYRIHQFAGGLDSETMFAFEELRQRACTHGRGSRDLIPGITLS